MKVSNGNICTRSLLRIRAMHDVTHLTFHILYVIYIREGMTDIIQLHPIDVIQMRQQTSGIETKIAVLFFVVGIIHVFPRASIGSFSLDVVWACPEIRQRTCTIRSEPHKKKINAVTSAIGLLLLLNAIAI